MPVTLRLMSWNIQKKQTNFKFIAKIIQKYQIDICALLEVPNGSTDTICDGIITELDNIPYKPGLWKKRPVNVGDEAVAYIWHEALAAGANAFKKFAYSNDATSPISGPVLKDSTGAIIYFPETGTNWQTARTGKPNGRRAAYCGFMTNDGAAPRYFTFLDVHTPFAQSLIQSYTSTIYAASRELSQVETLSPIKALTAASVNALALIEPALMTWVPTSISTAKAAFVSDIAGAAVDGVTRGASIRFAAGDAIAAAVAFGAELAARETVAALTGLPAMTRSVAEELVHVCSLAALMAAAYLGASIQQATAPPAAIGDAGTAARAAAGLVLTALDQPWKPAKPTPSSWRTEILRATRVTTNAVITQFTFPAIPTQNLHAAVAAGDFNVNYPDGTLNYPAPLTGQNAYSKLIANVGAARIASTTTRSTDYASQFIYTLRAPTTIQHTNPLAANYVPLDVSSIAGQRFMGNAQWTSALQTLASGQGVAWALLKRAPYAQLLLDAFDQSEVIDVPALFRANAYDNMFVRAATVVSSGLIDVMSELGCWPQRAAAVPNPQPPAFAPNPWPAAGAGLNQAARDVVAVEGVDYYYNRVKYTIAATITDAQDAAIFFDQYISDHLPVYVEIRL